MDVVLGRDEWHYLQGSKLEWRCWVKSTQRRTIRCSYLQHKPRLKANWNTISSTQDEESFLLLKTRVGTRCIVSGDLQLHMMLLSTKHSPTHYAYRLTVWNREDEESFVTEEKSKDSPLSTFTSNSTWYSDERFTNSIFILTHCRKSWDQNNNLFLKTLSKGLPYSVISSNSTWWS